MDYTETINYLIRHTSLTGAKIFQFKGSPGEEYFEKFFQYYSNNLAHNKDFGANPSYIVFYNKNEIYAEAKKSNHHYIIAFDKGIIKQLSQWYNLYFDFAQIEGLEEFDLLEKELNFKISTLLEQAINHYTFYHEFAHLVQYVTEKDYERKDYLFGDCNYDLTKHIEEYDADIFSGICLAEHIFDFVSKQFKDDLNEDRLNNFIAITISSVMAYILSLPMCKEEFYTKESSHPHNSIRVNNMNMVIINQFKDIIDQDKSSIKVNEEFIRNKSFMISMRLLKHFGLHNVATRFSEDIDKKWSFIEEYCNELHEKTLKYESSALKKWNSI